MAIVFYERPTSPYLIRSDFVDSPALNSGFHYHNSYELFYLLSGSRTYTRFPDIFYLEQDYITLTNPYTLHATSGQAYSRICIHFTKDFLLQYFNEKHVEKLLQCFSIDSISNAATTQNPLIKKAVLELHTYIQDKNWELAAYSLGQVLSFLAPFAEAANEHPAKRPNLIKDVCNYINLNLANLKSLSEISDHFHFSKSYLFHLFKKETGLTLSTYLNEMRINRAMYLLKNTNTPIQEIARECGYDESAYFCLCFKKKLNHTPSNYRKLFK